jgi:hypothetical protein
LSSNQNTVTWKELKDVIERLARLEERLDSLSKDISILQNKMSESQESYFQLSVQIKEVKDVVATNLEFYRKMLYRIVTAFITTVATVVITIILRLI